MKNDKTNEQTIDCDVHDCTHCDCTVDTCGLHGIKVSSCSPEEKKEATICDSYEKKNME